MTSRGLIENYFPTLLDIINLFSYHPAMAETKLHDVRKTNFLKGALLQRGWTLGRVAAHTGTSTPTVSRIINGHARSLKVEGAIAQIIGLPWAALFLPLKRQATKPRRSLVKKTICRPAA